MHVIQQHVYEERVLRQHLVLVHQPILVLIVVFLFVVQVVQI
jgi:hypothetical protein